MQRFLLRLPQLMWGPMWGGFLPLSKMPFAEAAIALEATLKDRATWLSSSQCC